MPRRVIDCVIYNGEPILELRLRLLDAVVDRFVVVESTVTFKGDAKTLRFDPAAFARWVDRIDWIVLQPEDFADCDSAWARETTQRNAVLRGLQGLADDDLVLLSDVDELPCPEAVTSWDGRPTALTQWMFAYYGNLLCRSEPLWLKGTRMVPASALCRHTPEDIRLRFEACFPEGRTIERGGWHISYLGGVESIQRKIREFSHQEMNTEELNHARSIQRQLDARLDIFYRPLAYAAVPPDSLGSAQVVEWLRERNFLYPGPDDGRTVDDWVARFHGHSRRMHRRLRSLLKRRQAWRRFLARWL